MISAADFQSYSGPGDKYLPNGTVDGYQPVSRIGEVQLISQTLTSMPKTNMYSTVIRL